MVKHISEFLNNFVSPEDRWKIKLLQNWDKIIGEFKDKVDIEKIDRNLLVLRVCHSAWAQELFLLSHMLKKKINDFLGKNYIKHIRFKSGGIKKTKKVHTKKSYKKPTCIDSKDIYLTLTEKKGLSKVTDKELREHLEKFYLCCKRGRSQKCLEEKIFQR